jgi:tripartite-type tricarboxylate transporter receptor subunit TctC
MKRRLLLNILSSAAMALPCAVSMAQTSFPTKAVRLIVPFAAGGSADMYARLMAQELSSRWSQPVIVDNRVGAGGSIGQQALLAAPPDGHTLILVSSSFVLNPLINPKLPYADKDFKPVIGVAATANALIVPVDSKYKTLRDLMEDARARPGGLSYGMAGNGTSPHIAGEMFKFLTKLDIVAVPYKGNAPVMADVMAGQIPMGYAAVVDVLPFVKGGKMRALAVASKTRSPQMPDVPTFAEAGLKDFESVVWWGVIASAGVPDPVVADIHRDIDAVLKMPAIRSRIGDGGSEVINGPRPDFVRYVDAERKRLQPVLKAANIRAD